jgi:hypothetical protein
MFMAVLSNSRRCLGCFLVAVLLVCGMLAAPARAATDFGPFLADFRQALARDDGARIAAMTHLPFLFEGQALDRRGFLQRYPRLFDAPTRRCMARAKPIEEDGARVIFCRPYAFYFRPVQGAWRLVEFGADGEDMP